MALKHLAPVDCERNICERICMGLQNRDLRKKFLLKPTEKLSVALTRSCEALEQLDEKRVAEDSFCLSFSQHSLNPEFLPRRNQQAVPVDGGVLALKAVQQTRTTVWSQPTDWFATPEGNMEPVLFLVVTGASRSLIHSRLAARLTKHWTTVSKPVRLLAANGTEMQVASSLSASVQLGSFTGEHHFLVCPHLQWRAILGLDFLGRFGGVLNLTDSQMTIGSCPVGLESGQPAEVCLIVDSKAKVSLEIEVLDPLSIAMAQGHMKDAQRRQKGQYDQHISGPVYSAGHRVGLHRPNAGVSESARLHHQWQGPYEVVFVRWPPVDVIRDPQSASSEVMTVHYKQLKPASPTSHCELHDIIVPPGSPTGRGVSQRTDE
ncbi:hypothetical protein P879_04334 [Paragonimus westermani]|uniref:Peptidase A2 domain-containing protein n=1 Tax=Paragonimus westermani TaxID=34504 RepID=A0A8T0DMM5_9TREM|nr:hypothetical protein P879_04334 [Paragonimus westermani]